MNIPLPPPSRNQVIWGDNLKITSGWPDNCIDGICTDPPYGLEFMGKEWDKLNLNVPFSENEKGGLGGYKHHIRFGDDSYAMQQWHYQWAKAMLRITKPGGFLLAFGGTRTYHRLACAIEDAGWEIRDCMMWLYGSGFPKSHDISKAVDKKKGAKREVVGKYSVPGFAKSEVEHGKQNRTKYEFEQTSNQAATDLAQLWNGYGTALKPAWEPIIVAMKPKEGSFADNAEKYGVAGLNIDGGRINYQSEQDKKHNTEALNRFDSTSGNSGAFMASKSIKPNVERTALGRWPANLILDEEAGKMLDEQSGIVKTGTDPRRKTGVLNSGGMYGAGKKALNVNIYTDKGGASRFFKILEPEPCFLCGHIEEHGNLEVGPNVYLCDECLLEGEALDLPKRFLYCAKTSRKERNLGCENLLQIGVEICEENMEQVELLKKGISELTERWLIELFGKKNMDQYQMGFTSTTKMEINKTTILTTLNLLTPLPINEYILDVIKMKMMNGGNPVVNVENIKEWKPIFIKELMEFLLGANPVALKTQLKINVSVGCTHPTIKPLALMKYLCTLLKMPGQNQVILDPFLGSGTTAMACKELGINYIGIEKEKEYCEIAKRRIAAITYQGDKDGEK